MKEFFKQIFQDHKQQYSSKRFIAIVGAISLITTMCLNPNDILVNGVLILVCSALGISCADRFVDKDK